jgi:RNA polymerase sigma factor (TIGR02999 family)
LDELFRETYKELLRMAASVKRNDIHATISTSTLVHETWMRLAKSSARMVDSEAHFRHLAACAMRNIVTSAARHRRAFKRGGGVAMFITFVESLDVPMSRNEDLISLSDALDELSTVSPRQAAVVELRFYAGYGMAEIAESLGVAEKTVERDWKVARAWLAAQIRRSGGNVEEKRKP